MTASSSTTVAWLSTQFIQGISAQSPRGLNFSPVATRPQSQQSHQTHRSSTLCREAVTTQSSLSTEPAWQYSSMMQGIAKVDPRCQTNLSQGPTRSRLVARPAYPYQQPQFACCLPITGAPLPTMVVCRRHGEGGRLWSDMYMAQLTLLACVGRTPAAREWYHLYMSTTACR